MTPRQTRVVDQPPALPPPDSQAGLTSSLESTAVMMTNRQQPCAPDLGADELKCLQLLSNGHPVSDIARMTGNSGSDVEAQLDSAQAKLGARNRLQALLAATRLGLFPLI